MTFDLVATMDSILQERMAREVSTGSELPSSAVAAWLCWSEACCTLSTADRNQSKNCVGASNALQPLSATGGAAGEVDTCFQSSFRRLSVP